MRTSPQFRMAERVLGGDLAEHLQALYTDTASWEEVARRLLVEHEIVVSGQTLRKWAKKATA